MECMDPDVIPVKNIPIRGRVNCSGNTWLKWPTYHRLQLRTFTTESESHHTSTSRGRQLDQVITFTTLECVSHHGVGLTGAGLSVDYKVGGDPFNDSWDQWPIHSGVHVLRTDFVQKKQGQSFEVPRGSDQTNTCKCQNMSYFPSWSICKDYLRHHDKNYDIV